MGEAFHRGGAGEPLVLLHGITSSWHGWKPVLPALEQRYDVIALTLPGHLDFPWPEGAPPSIATMADLVLDRLAGLGVDRPHLAGNSLGGWIALELAARREARSVTAFSPAGGWLTPLTGEFFLETQRRVAELRPDAEQVLADPDRRRRLMGIFMQRGDLMPLEEAVRSWDALLAVETLAAMTEVFGAPQRSPVPEDAVVSIVWCAQDQLLPEGFGAPGWKEAAPAAEWSHVEGGHTPMYDNPDGVVAAIDATVARAR